jgi:hypothetical protein
MLRWLGHWLLSFYPLFVGPASNLLAFPSSNLGLDALDLRS